MGRINFRPPGDVSPQAVFLLKAMKEDNVMEVLTYLRNTPDWIDLYKAFELMRTDISQRFGEGGEKKIGWPSDRKIRTFTSDAQFFRHSKAKWPKRDPNSSMPLPEARSFIQELCRKWLDAF
ncbi:hypothetical protein [Rhodopseudomonas sp. RCAM05734]|uniref:hypothetical protein n=1 Tax=Rhodopseudomonas sp. RCAM05734 TaxID=3457549 RepID=UPI0040445D10